MYVVKYEFSVKEEKKFRLVTEIKLLASISSNTLPEQDTKRHFRLALGQQSLNAIIEEYKMIIFEHLKRMLTKRLPAAPINRSRQE